MRMQEKWDSHRLVAALHSTTMRRPFRILHFTCRISSIKKLCFLLLLASMALSACTHSMNKAEQPSPQAPEFRTEKEIEQSWNGDYPVAQLAVLTEKAEKGTGYIGDSPTFIAVWAAFKTGDPVPER